MSRIAAGARIVLGALVLAGGCTLAGAASAEMRAVATADLNLRAGPSTREKVRSVIGSRRTVRVLGCLPDRDWCEVGFDGRVGWVSSAHLSAPEPRRGEPDARAGLAVPAPPSPARPRGASDWSDPGLYSFDILVSPDVRLPAHDRGHDRGRHKAGDGPAFPIDPHIGARRAGDRAAPDHRDRPASRETPAFDRPDHRAGNRERDDRPGAASRRRENIRQAREARRDEIREAREDRRQAIRDARDRRAGDRGSANVQNGADLIRRTD